MTDSTGHDWLPLPDWVEANAGGKLSGSFVRKLCRSGELKAFKLGALWMVHADALDLYYERQREG